ncbi:glycoside hydrolase family 51 protein [Hyaloscypha variabilis]
MLLKLALFSSLVASTVNAYNLSVAATGGNVSSPLMYGLMFEDINHSGDGGIYAELIQNRAFQESTEFPSTLDPWKATGDAVLTLQDTQARLSRALPYSVNVAPASANTTGKVGLLNPGWWGIDVKPQKYTGSFWVLGKYTGPFTVSLQSAITNEVFATVEIPSTSVDHKWTQQNYTIIPTKAAPNSNNTFILEYEASAGPLNFNLISLFPPTYNNRPNGMRPDLMEAMKALNPSFLRMPGGNNIEGDAFHYPWLWNNTIGPLTDRPGRPGTWGYQNTDGLGLVEYLNWCTDLGAEPVLAVWSGMYLITNGSTEVLTEAELAPYVQNVLDELEFILGDTNTHNGALRASLGYPEPWALKYVEIGNEDNLWGGEPSYDAYRWNLFFDAIHEKWPDLTLISSTQDQSVAGPGSAWDYHIYTRPDDFVSKFDYWDHVARNHSILQGEYANIQGNIEGGGGTNWSAPRIPWPIWVGAVSESIWTLGIERNGDVMIGASYAPGFQNLNSYQWQPDLVAFTADPAQTVLSTSWYAIKLLSAYRYEHTVPVTVTSGDNFGPAYYVAGVSAMGQYTFKVATYNATSSVPFNLEFEGVKAGQKGTLTVLSASGPDNGGLSSNVLVGDTLGPQVRYTTVPEGGIDFLVNFIQTLKLVTID